MLIVLTARPVHPEVESPDRDPGIITLLSALVRSARRAGGMAADEARAGRRTVPASGLLASSSAWPHSQR